MTKKTSLKKKWIFAGTTLAFFVLALFAFINAGNYLVQKDQLTKADAVLILMGTIADRVLETNDIYLAAYTENILIVDNMQIGREQMQTAGISIPNKAALSISALQQLGIDSEKITLLPGQAASTRAEAEITANYLKQNPHIDTLIIVSSAAHMRRAGMIFKDTFNDHNLNVIVLSSPSKYSGFNAKHWWKHRESAKQVFMEYVKITSFLLVEQWQ